MNKRFKLGLVATSLLATVSLMTPSVILANQNNPSGNAQASNQPDQEFKMDLQVYYQFWDENGVRTSSLDQMESRAIQRGEVIHVSPKAFPGYKLYVTVVNWTGQYEVKYKPEESDITLYADDAFREQMEWLIPQGQYEGVVGVFFGYIKDTATTASRTFTVEVTFPDGNRTWRDVTLKAGESFDATAMSGYDASKHTLKEGKMTYRYDEVTDGQTVRIVLEDKFIAPPKPPVTPPSVVKSNEVRRFYNANTRTHLWTNNATEFSSLRAAGWKDEGRAFYASINSGEPVYRMYNPSIRRHLLTKNTNEYNLLSRTGWRKEGIAFYSSGTIPVYRFYNPSIQRHLYTKDSNEYRILGTRGWKQEGIAWYVER